MIPDAVLGQIGANEPNKKKGTVGRKALVGSAKAPYSFGNLSYTP